MRARRRRAGYEGLQEDVRGLRLPRIETWTNKYPDREYELEIRTAEFTSVCPKTGLPDFGEVVLRYVPAGRCIELKSFKEYLTAYRDLGIFYEHAANKILEDVVRACRPRRAELEARFNVRGGMATVVRARYSEKDGFGIRPSDREKDL